MNSKEKIEIYNAYVDEIRNLDTEEIEKRIETLQLEIKKLERESEQAVDIWEERLKAAGAEKDV